MREPTIEIVSRQAAERILSPWPHDVSYGRRYGVFQHERYGLQEGFAVVSNGDERVLFPIFWDNHASYSVHKSHTMPAGRTNGISWRMVADMIRKLTNTNFFIADLALPEPAPEADVLPFAIFVLDTTHPYDDVAHSFSKTTRNLVRRSSEQGFTLRTHLGVLHEEHYELYIRHQESRGTPPREKNYFDQLAHVFGDGFMVFAAYDGSIPVGMNIVLSDNHGFWLSINASLPEAANRHVNYLLYDAMIQWACQNGIQRIDFGGSPTSEGNIHNTFKLGFGPHMIPLYRIRSGTLTARLRDFIERKRRAMSIRLNLWKKH